MKYGSVLPLLALWAVKVEQQALQVLILGHEFEVKCVIHSALKAQALKCS